MVSPLARVRRSTLLATTALLAMLVATATHSRWLPWLSTIAGRQLVLSTDSDHEADHGPEHEPIDDHHDTSVLLSAEALKNINFRPRTVAIGNYTRSISLPAIVVERPGRSQIQITAPFTGVVTRIVPVNGSAIEPGAALFELRLTHEELVAAQSNLIRTAESIDVVDQEIKRLQSVGDGVVAGKRVLEQVYERRKLEAGLRAERQALLLHGLTEAQIDSIVNQRKLFQQMTVTAPGHEHDNDNCSEHHLFHVQQLAVELGQQVEAGAVLCVLADHCELHIEGRAFEDDATRLREAVRQGWNITASVVVGEQVTESISGLRLLYLADRVDPDSRAFKFYLRLPNSVVLDQTDSSGNRFLDWRFKPGQRMQLQVPVEEWTNRIVLPRDAVVDEGPEAFVYRQNGERFERVSVRVEYRDQESVVLASDGTLFPGDVVAEQGAFQMHLAAKNATSGGMDPHAGHNH